MTRLVGVLNLTPNSFSDGGEFVNPETALAHAEAMFADGAYFVDVGAESTKPGAEPITPDEEWARLEPVLPSLVSRHPSRISLDTYHPETAERALRMHGNLIINDITGLHNPGMVDVITRYGASCIISHLPSADPQAERHGTLLNVGDESRIVEHLLGKKALLVSRGIGSGLIIIDPGIGFAKSADLNDRLLEFPRLVPGHAVMLGYSRKRFLGDQRMELEPNLEAGRRAIAAGAAFIRVHDVAGHRQLPGITVD